MKKHCINFLSVSPVSPPEVLAVLARMTARVDILSTVQGRKVGVCDSYWLDGEDLWAEAWLDDDADCSAGIHAESVIAMKDGAPILCAVVLTSLPRGMLQAAPVGASFTEAVRFAVETALGRSGRQQGQA